MEWKLLTDFSIFLLYLIVIYNIFSFLLLEGFSSWLLLSLAQTKKVSPSHDLLETSIQKKNKIKAYYYLGIHFNLPTDYREKKMKVR